MECFIAGWVPITRVNVQSSDQQWTYSDSVMEVLSVEPSEMG